MALQATRLIRKMRGGAQAHLMQASDGKFYVVKFTNNPQHRRILVNELISSVFLEYLQLAAARWQLVGITPDLLREFPEMGVQIGTRKVDVPIGWHFGSEYPGDPNRLAVYDYLPDALLRKVENLRDFLGVLVFDKWVGNADARQSVFFRARLRDWTTPSAGARTGFVGLMIDHGYTFNGPNWDFADAPAQGFYVRPMVYETVRSLDDFEPWLSQVREFPDRLFDEAYKRIPDEWLEDDRDALEALLEKLRRRRARAAYYLEDSRGARGNPFPNWRG